MESEKNGLNEMEVAYAMSTPFGAGIETVSSRFGCLGLISLLMAYYRLRGRS